MAKGKGTVGSKSKGDGGPTHNSGGSGSTSKSQSPMPGPTSPGKPASLRKALTRSAPRGKGI